MIEDEDLTTVGTRIVVADTPGTAENNKEAAAADLVDATTDHLMIDFANNVWPCGCTVQDTCNSEGSQHPHPHPHPVQASSSTSQPKSGTARTANATCNSNGNSNFNAAYDPVAVDSMMAKEMDRLSFQERNEIYEEIHGVSTMATRETPTLIRDTLQRLNAELDARSSSSSTSPKPASESSTTSASASAGTTNHAYSIAIAYAATTLAAGSSSASSCPRHTTTKDPSTAGTRSNTTCDHHGCSHSLKDSFKLRFLRCELFNPILAAKRIRACFDLIYQVYGRTGLQNFVWIECINYHYHNHKHPPLQLQHPHNGSKPTAGQAAVADGTAPKMNSHTKTKRRSSKNKNDPAAARRLSRPLPTGFKTTLMEFFLDTKADMKALTAGYCQTLPFRDRSGRKCIVNILDMLQLEGLAGVRSLLLKHGIKLFWFGLFAVTFIPTLPFIVS